MTWETILVDGVDIASAGVRIIQVWDGAHTAAADRGSPIVIPGQDGALDVARAFDTTVLSVGMQLRGASLLTGLNDVMRALRLVCKPGQAVTLTRRMSYTSGNETHTAAGRYLSGLTPELLTPAIARLVLNFTVMSGVWHGSAFTPTIPATITVSGEVRTQKITLVLPGAGTLTNTTTGTAVTVTTGPVTLDVDAETSTGSVLDVVASGDALGRWFTLLPGSNVITWSGSGTPTISYLPAYL